MALTAFSKMPNSNTLKVLISGVLRSVQIGDLTSYFCCKSPLLSVYIHCTQIIRKLKTKCMVQLCRISPSWFGTQLSSHLSPPAHLSQISLVHALFLSVPLHRSPPSQLSHTLSACCPIGKLSSPNCRAITSRDNFIKLLQPKYRPMRGEGGLQQSRCTRWQVFMVIWRPSHASGKVRVGQHQVQQQFITIPGL